MRKRYKTNLFGSIAASNMLKYLRGEMHLEIPEKKQRGRK